MSHLPVQISCEADVWGEICHQPGESARARAMARALANLCPIGQIVS